MNTVELKTAYQLVKAQIPMTRMINVQHQEQIFKTAKTFHQILCT